MYTQKIVHLLMKEMMKHIMRKNSKIVILDIEEYHNLITKVILEEDKSMLEENEQKVKNFFAFIKTKQVRYLFSEVYSNTIVLYPRCIEYNGEKVVSVNTPRIDIRFDCSSIKL